MGWSHKRDVRYIRVADDKSSDIRGTDAKATLSLNDKHFNSQIMLYFMARKTKTHKICMPVRRANTWFKVVQLSQNDKDHQLVNFASGRLSDNS